MLVHRLGAPSDFDPLLERIGSARVVMLGEASHGTYDYYRIREQITRRLVAECGFSFVAVEGDWPDCDLVHRSVTAAPGGDADPQTALERFDRWPTWMWANAEVARFCRWLRAWNLNRPEPERVGFHGLDVYSLWESMQAILDYLGEEDPASLEAAQEAYRCFEPYGSRIEEYGVASRFVSARCEDEVVRLLARMRERAARDGADAFSAWQNAEVVAGAEKYYRAMVGGGPRSWNVRDTHMADTLDRLLERYGAEARAVIWAHNTHVGDARATDMAPDGMVNIGQLARERYGAGNVVLVGFGSYEGTVVAADRWGAPYEVMAVPPARAGSLEERLHTLLPDRALLILSHGDKPDWLVEEADHRAIGVVYDPSFEAWGNYVPTRLGDRYDAFVWCDHTTALHPLPASVAPGELETYPSGV
ncbi:erythromycin esterase family protein [Micromonospora sp. HM5-17]|jgi:erythromycin esterase-like protein|uniref:erythromycin esterase family protein n=1 Tax=Micromonospora sp. HM5-17 TaxID=2487710 RepID=UPI000F4A263E|nr:erythromycin esterase family protein [Micromonospora sp. HM5-17]ROT32312.1 erythromycin esterase family protein [Micromonospora sp. HM5-17]